MGICTETKSRYSDPFLFPPYTLCFCIQYALKALPSIYGSHKESGGGSFKPPLSDLVPWPPHPVTASVLSLLFKISPGSIFLSRLHPHRSSVPTYLSASSPGQCFLLEFHRTPYSFWRISTCRPCSLWFLSSSSSL